MRKLIVGYFVVAAVLGIAYGLTKGVMHYRVHRAIEDLVAKASPYGELAYDSLDTSVTGKVAVHRVTYRPAGASDDIRVETIRIVGPNAWFFIRPDVNLGGTDASIPPHLHVSAEAIRIQNNDWSYLARWSDSAPNEPCASHEPLKDSELLSDLGFDELLFDVDMGWNAAESSRELTASFGIDVRGMHSVQGSVTLADMTLAALQGREAIPQLGGFEFAVNMEPQFTEKLASVCAERLNISPSDYRKRLVAYQRAAVRMAGVDLGPGLVFALESFSEGGEIKLVARPKEPLGAMSLAFLPPDQIVDRLGMTLQVNDTLVTDLSFSMAIGGSGSVSGWAALFDKGAKPTQPRPVRPRYQRVWERVSPKRLSQYVNREVRVYSRNQPVRTGTLISANHGIAEIQQRVHGGHYTAHVQLAQVTQAEVEVRKQINVAQTATNSATQYSDQQ